MLCPKGGICFWRHPRWSEMVGRPTKIHRVYIGIFAYKKVLHIGEMALRGIKHLDAILEWWLGSSGSVRTGRQTDRMEVSSWVKLQVYVSFVWAGSSTRSTHGFFTTRDIIDHFPRRTEQAQRSILAKGDSDDHRAESSSGTVSNPSGILLDQCHQLLPDQTFSTPLLSTPSCLSGNKPGAPSLDWATVIPV